MPYFIVEPAGFQPPEAGIHGPFASREEAEATRTGESRGPHATVRIIEADDREAAESLVRQAFSPSPDA